MSADDVTLDGDTARAYAAALRERRPITWPEGLTPEALADLLDPRPSLRETASRTVRFWLNQNQPDQASPEVVLCATEAVLADVGTAIANLPHSHGFALGDCQWCACRRTVLDLIGGIA